MSRYYYSDTISGFLQKSSETITGILTKNCAFSITHEQITAWEVEIEILKNELIIYKNRGGIFFEYAIPRMGKRIDVAVIIDGIVFVLEFKVGALEFYQADFEQAWDYALDLKNFHKESHACSILPILIATRANKGFSTIQQRASDGVFSPVMCNSAEIKTVLSTALNFIDPGCIDIDKWGDGEYSPSATIIEAARALYLNHSVENIMRCDAQAKNLTSTTKAVSDIIETAQKTKQKAICFVTGVPGAGKTLVGLNIATKYMDKTSQCHSVYLSGNGPLVKVLTEVLAVDKVATERAKGQKMRKEDAKREVSAFIQIIHHWRDYYLQHKHAIPDHVTIFDEAQRVWDLKATVDFMVRKKKQMGFHQSEAEFLISVMDRHPEWCVVVCLVGGGQEINRGENGIAEWIDAWKNNFPDWHLFISSELTDSEYGATTQINAIRDQQKVTFQNDLHLSVSMRSFRAEHVSRLVKNVLDLNVTSAKAELKAIVSKYPIVLTRSLVTAKKWLKSQARGSARYGIVVSSQAQRLKPHAIDVRVDVDPVNWFLKDKDDTRSSFYLEDAASEFVVQGLELDWACVTWDGDFRYTATGWDNYSFSGSSWKKINKEERQSYQKNAYRVLLTRARQGMIIVVPEGDTEDPTRKHEYYDPTFEYLKSIGFEVI
jgi:Uncharacterized conserved protein (DUF2075)